MGSAQFFVINSARHFDQTNSHAVQLAFVLAFAVLVGNVSLDGFDFDVLLSGRSVISEKQPLVFAEFSFIDGGSLGKYLNLVDFFISAKYTRAFIFRNTGAFECSIDLNKLEDFLRKNVNSLNQYVGVSYFDILFSAENYSDVAKLAVDDFKKL